MKFFIFLAFITSQTFASTVLLNRQRMSGFVPPEYVFSKVCNIYTDGKVIIKSRLGSNPEVTTASQITAKDVLLIDIVLEVAARGRIYSIPVICDAGTDILNGYRRGRKIILDENRDCSSHLKNSSRTLPILKDWSISYCGF